MLCFEHLVQFMSCNIFKMKISKNRSFEIILVILCLLGLTYHLLQIIHQYQLGKTVVSIQVLAEDDGKLPGVTVCYDAMISSEKFQVHYPELAENVKQNYDKDPHISNYFLYKSNWTNYQELIDNLSLPFSSDGNPVITLMIFGRSLDNDQINPDLLKNDIVGIQVHKFIGQPVESLNFFYQHKCFTFFSALKPWWKNYRVLNEKGILLQIRFSQQWYPIKKNHFAKILLHSPNILPVMDSQALPIYIGQYSSFQYNKIEMQYLEGDYDKSCHNYDLDANSTKINNKHDCLFGCLVHHYGPNCSFYIILSYTTILTMDNLPAGHNGKLCDQFEHVKLIGYDQVYSSCQKLCKSECYQAQYFYSGKVIGQSRVANGIEVMLNRNALPDISIEYMPEMTFISLVCNLGGLVGMWCGASVLASLKDLLSLIKFSYYKIKIRFNNCNFQNNNNIRVVNRVNNLILNVSTETINYN